MFEMHFRVSKWRCCVEDGCGRFPFVTRDINLSFISLEMAFEDMGLDMIIKRVRQRRKGDQEQTNILK